MSGSGKCCVGCKVVKLLAGIGALNWGLVALFDYNVVSGLLGQTGIAKAVYVLIGIAGLMTLASFIKCCPCCKKKDGEACSTK